jgi:hypothetical protein
MNFLLFSNISFEMYFYSVYFMISSNLSLMYKFCVGDYFLSVHVQYTDNSFVYSMGKARIARNITQFCKLCKGNNENVIIVLKMSDY